MTDKVNMFNKAGNAMQRTVGYNRATARVYNLTEAFKRRDITFGGIDDLTGQNEI